MPRDLLAFAWDADDPQGDGQAQALAAALAAQGPWRRAWEGRGLHIWTRGGPSAEVAPLPGGRGVAVGRLFAREDASPLPPRAPRPTDPAPTAAARALCVGSWGEYVAVFPDAGGRAWVLRDPSGAIDLLTWRRGALALAASDLVDLPDLATPARMGLDWTAIPDLLRAPALAHDRTALGLAAPVPGALHPLGEGRSAAITVWSPGEAARAALDLGDDGPRRLARCIVSTVGRLAEGYARLSAEVSGGLDSAIVAAALAAAGHGPRIVQAVNYHAPSALADERPWAEAVCRRLGLPLCAVRRPATRLRSEDFAELARHARPALNALDAPRDRDAAARAAAGGAEAIFTGKGGDAILLQSLSPLVLADRLQAAGPGALAGPFAQGLAHALRRSVWSVGWDAARAAWLASPPAAPALAGHPWLQGLDDLPPAKRRQIAGLVTAQAHRGVNRRSRVADLVHPLLAQPVVELCLGIPAWRLVSDDGRVRGRALARAAFADRLPSEVVARRSKGDLTTHYGRGVAASLDVLRPLLLDGVLAHTGLLDRAALERALDPDELIYRPDANLVLSAAAVESWVRWWQGRVPDLPPERPEPG